MSNGGNTFISRSVEQTIKYGCEFAKDLQAGAIVALRGNLGAGKTTFVKGMAEAFGIDPGDVHSPTFSLINEYCGELQLFHMDFYRLEHEREAAEIGAEDYFYRDGVCVIEWPEKIRSLLPKKIIRITFKNSSPHVRQINITEKD